MRLADVPRPAASPRDVLIRVLASSINPVDRKTREGDFRAMRDYPMPFVPGWDAAGIVEEIGTDVTGFAHGDAVFALPGARGGGWAEFCAVPANSVAPKPETLSSAEAGSLPLVALTAWQGLFVHGSLQSGQRVLVHAAAGGVGSQAVQLAHAKGAHVTAMVNTGSVDQVQALGADKILDYDNYVFAAYPEGMDVVLDLLGGDFQEKSWAALKPGGILVSTVGPPSAEKAEAAGGARDRVRGETGRRATARDRRAGRCGEATRDRRSRNPAGRGRGGIGGDHLRPVPWKAGAARRRGLTRIDFASASGRSPAQGTGKRQ